MLAVAGRPAARVAAALLALALSGGVRLLPAGPVSGPHRCSCRSHGEDHLCACAVCNAQARRARKAARPEDLPPCHRDAARRAAAQEEARARRAALPGLLPTCGDPEGGLAAPGALDPFAVPARPALALAEWRTTPAAPAATAPERAPRPAVPPPRPSAVRAL
ncbi:conserved hypothetical protein [Anaeromyxobacter dehalogenans 2CP-1]|uniref:Uncharacterized protein n=1 Tax=Anaeromyxobacter dehalogenans (strain ATCC BAA-258 / DSM 21875 / 2CP-1) TaxID=455488 RepID=B8JBU8_ANAD2|nr:hypothetical protein [Anaeromyxobacter dehalogenans]ACL63870.1 conserved hypothetical protein [Anaeromyxobacter dehalogenans 2CP-1]